MEAFDTFVRDLFSENHSVQVSPDLLSTQPDCLNGELAGPNWKHGSSGI